MAQVDTNNPNDPNNPNNQSQNVNQPGQTQANQPTTSGGAGAVTTTGAGNVTGQVVGTKNPAQPFQNIASYLAANEQGGKDLAGQVAGTVSAPITQAQTWIQSAADTFTGQVNAGYTPKNQDLITAVGQNPAYVVAENPENVTNFQTQLKDTYTGPTDFTQMGGYGDLQAKIAAAQGAAANTQNEAGIQSLLQNVEGPTTAGINKLDSLLLSANPQNYQTIQAAGAPAADLLPTLQSTTAAQNALAQKGTTEASSAAADAAAALQAALSGEKGNLSNQSDIIQGIINEYNQSVGIINPVTQNIAAAIQNYLAANPNLKGSDVNAILAPLMNLNTINTPDLSTYASPYDYKTISALQQLGLSPEDMAKFGITPEQANLAQTFQIPGELQNAVGQAPGVESGLKDVLKALSGQITGAYQPYVDLTTRETERANLVTQANDLQMQIRNLQRNPPPQQINVKGQGYVNNPEYAAYQAKIADLTQQYQTVTSNPNYVIPNYWPQISQMAQGLQWLEPASTGYNALIDQINAELGKLGQVGVPTLNYHPDTLSDPVTGVPIGQIAAQDIGKAANTAALGATGAAGIGSGILAGTEMAGAPLATGFGVGDSALIGAQSAMQTLGPAALAAYGTSNIAQNLAAHPITGGLSVLGNTLTLGALSLPPQILQSIGSGLKNVINSIGDFFGGLF